MKTRTTVQKINRIFLHAAWIIPVGIAFIVAVAMIAFVGLSVAGAMIRYQIGDTQYFMHQTEVRDLQYGCIPYALFLAIYVWCYLIALYYDRRKKRRDEEMKYFDESH